MVGLGLLPSQRKGEARGPAASFSLLALAAACLPVAGRADSILISSYFDDPFVGPPVIKRMTLGFSQYANLCQICARVLLI